MLRQYFFPSSYRKRSHLSIKLEPEVKHDTSNFIKRLEFSCRRPSTNFKTSIENEAPGVEDNIPSLKKSEKVLRSFYIKRKSHEDSQDKEKGMVNSESKTSQSFKAEGKKLSTRLIASQQQHRIGRQGISEIKNADWNLKGSSEIKSFRKMCMSERRKVRNKQEIENVIIGWDYEYDDDQFFY